MCLGKVWGVKQLCLSVFHIADSIGSGRGRHGWNSLEREILSYVFAANGLEGEKKRDTETNWSVLSRYPILKSFEAMREIDSVDSLLYDTLWVG